MPFILTLTSMQVYVSFHLTVLIVLGGPGGPWQYLAVSDNNFAEKEIGLTFATSAGERPNLSFWIASVVH